MSIIEVNIFSIHFFCKKLFKGEITCKKTIKQLFRQQKIKISTKADFDMNFDKRSI